MDFLLFFQSFSEPQAALDQQDEREDHGRGASRGHQRAEGHRPDHRPIYCGLLQIPEPRVEPVQGLGGGRTGDRICGRNALYLEWKLAGQPDAQNRIL